MIAASDTDKTHALSSEHNGREICILLILWKYKYIDLHKWMCINYE